MESRRTQGRPPAATCRAGNIKFRQTEKHPSAPLLMAAPASHHRLHNRCWKTQHRFDGNLRSLVMVRETNQNAGQSQVSPLKDGTPGPHETKDATPSAKSEVQLSLGSVLNSPISCARGFVHGMAVNTPTAQRTGRRIP
ncbi:unnamed protein product [Lota lota]